MREKTAGKKERKKSLGKCNYSNKNNNNNNNNNNEHFYGA